jgi:acetolactate synthase regulatory subunit
MKLTHHWKIECNHTPETIDRILMPIRKRGLTVISLHYTRTDIANAVCTLQFELEAEDSERIYKNMLRIHDIQNVIRS